MEALPGSGQRQEQFGMRTIKAVRETRKWWRGAGRSWGGVQRTKLWGMKHPRWATNLPPFKPTTPSRATLHQPLVPSPLLASLSRTTLHQPQDCLPQRPGGLLQC